YIKLRIVTTCYTQWSVWGVNHLPICHGNGWVSSWDRGIVCSRPSLCSRALIKIINKPPCGQFSGFAHTNLNIGAYPQIRSTFYLKGNRVFKRTSRIGVYRIDGIGGVLGKRNGGLAIDKTP